MSASVCVVSTDFDDGHTKPPPPPPNYHNQPTNQSTNQPTAATALTPIFILQLTEQVIFYKEEIKRVLGQNDELVAKVKELIVYQQEAQVLRNTKNELTSQARFFLF